MSTQDLDPHLLATLDPEERAAFEKDDDDPADVDALKAVAGGADDDDEGDDDADDGGDDDKGAAPVEGKGAKDTDDGDDGEEADDIDEAPSAAPAPAPYRAELPQDYDAQIQSIRDEDAALRQKFKDGEIDIDERDAALAALAEKREALLIARTKAEISGDMTRQSAQQSWANEVKTFMANAAKNEGIDYRKDPKLQAELDKAVKLFANDPDNEDKPMSWFLEQGHAYVKFQRGMTGKPTTQAPAPATPPADPKKEAMAKRKPDLASLPKTLAGVPGGDGPGDVSGEFAHLDSLGGEDLESAIAKMSPAQRERYLRGE